jgi:hypothetical protein
VTPAERAQPRGPGLGRSTLGDGGDVVILGGPARVACDPGVGRGSHIGGGASGSAAIGCSSTSPAVPDPVTSCRRLHPVDYGRKQFSPAVDVDTSDHASRERAHRGLTFHRDLAPSVPVLVPQPRRPWSAPNDAWRYAPAMPRPSPEKWWNGMNDSDRSAFMDQVAMGRRVSLELWMKLRGAGVLPAPNRYGNHPWEYYLPAPYLRYVLARASERA